MTNHIPIEMREALECLGHEKMAVAIDLAHGVTFSEMSVSRKLFTETRIALAEILGLDTYEGVERLNNRQRKVFELTECHPELTQTKIAKMLRCNQRVVCYDIQAIKSAMPNWTRPLENPFQEREENRSLSWRELAFVNKAREVNFGEYTYDNCNFTGTDNPVWITCEKHGRVKITKAYQHIRVNNPQRKAGGVDAGTGKASARCPHCAYKPCGGTNVYLLEVSSGNEKFLKIGITNYDIKTRYRSHDYPNINIKQLGKIKFSDRSKARAKEKEILEELKRFKYTPKVEFHPTECLTMAAMNELKHLF